LNHNWHKKRILAIDPGKDCGFAWIKPDEGFYPQSFQITGTHDQFLQLMHEYYPDIIVYEQWKHTHRDGTDYTAIEFIGLIKWYVERRNVILIPQTNSYGKGYFDNAKLKKLGLFVPGKDHEDQMDALRHLLQFLMHYDMFDLGLLK
jgi:hypothetical protein